MHTILLDIIIAITLLEWLVLCLMIRLGLLLSLLPGFFSLCLPPKSTRLTYCRGPQCFAWQSRVSFIP